MLQVDPIIRNFINSEFEKGARLALVEFMSSHFDEYADEMIQTKAFSLVSFEQPYSDHMETLLGFCMQAFEKEGNNGGGAMKSWKELKRDELLDNDLAIMLLSSMVGYNGAQEHVLISALRPFWNDILFGPDEKVDDRINQIFGHNGSHQNLPKREPHIQQLFARMIVASKKFQLLIPTWNGKYVIENAGRNPVCAIMHNSEHGRTDNLKSILSTNLDKSVDLIVVDRVEDIPENIFIFNTDSWCDGTSLQAEEEMCTYINSQI